MKTNVTDSSIHSYDALKSNGMAACQMQILSVMYPGRRYTRRQIAGLTGLETSCVAGRVNELIQSGQIEVDGHVKCAITGRIVEAVVRPIQSGELFE